MDMIEQYKRVRRAGSWAFWFGIIQLALIPLVIAADLAATDLTLAEKQAAIAIVIVFQAVFGGLLIVYGRKLKASVIDGDVNSLDNAGHFIKVLSGTIIGGLIIALLSGGRAGLLLIAVILQLVWARSAIKTIRSAPAATPPAAPAAPAPAEPPITPPGV